MDRRKKVQVGDELHLDNGLEGLVVKEILAGYLEPLVFMAENDKKERYVFTLVQNTGNAYVWLAARIDNEVKEMNCYDIYRKPLDGFIYKVQLFAYQLISKVLPEDIGEVAVAYKCLMLKIHTKVDNSLENEIKLTDNQIKLILEAFEIKHNETGLEAMDEVLIAKLKNCLYGY